MVLPEAHVVYGTYGHLNATHDNVILMPSHYMAKLNGYEWLMGPGKALDPGKLFLVTTELFGNGGVRLRRAIRRSLFMDRDFR